MSGGRPWMLSEKRALHEMRSRRVSVPEIARALGRTTDAIYGFLRYIPATADSRPKVGKTPPLPPRPPRAIPKPSDVYWTHDETRSLRSLAEEGVSAKDAADILGRSPSAVRTRASLFNISFSSRSDHGPCRIEQETTLFNANATHASARLLQAIELAGVHP